MAHSEEDRPCLYRAADGEVLELAPFPALPDAPYLIPLSDTILPVYPADMVREIAMEYAATCLKASRSRRKQFDARREKPPGRVARGRE